MTRIVSDSPICRSLVGTAISGALDRQQSIEGFDQESYSNSHVLCIGAGGLVGHIAPTLVRKGIGAITILDDDVVEPSNLNRQRFYFKDIGENKAYAIAKNIIADCTYKTNIAAYPLLLEQAIDRGIDLS